MEERKCEMDLIKYFNHENVCFTVYDCFQGGAVIPILS